MRDRAQLPKADRFVKRETTVREQRQLAWQSTALALKET
jgi:hypothetical protein